MAISYPLTLPTTPGIKEMTWNKNTVVSAARSQYILSEQVQVYAGNRWEGSIVFPPFQRADAARMESFLLSLNGKEGSFLLGPIWATSPAGAGGPGQVDGASQTGRQLATKNWPINTLVLKAGDYFQLGSGELTRLYMVLTDVTSDGSGLATFDIWPRLRESPADSESLVLDNPQGTFRLADNLMSLDISVAAFFGVQFNVLEKVP